jgi:hypothetical protein
MPVNPVLTEGGRITAAAALAAPGRAAVRDRHRQDLSVAGGALVPARLSRETHRLRQRRASAPGRTSHRAQVVVLERQCARTRAGRAGDHVRTAGASAAIAVRPLKENVITDLTLISPVIRCARSWPSSQRQSGVTYALGCRVPQTAERLWARSEPCGIDTEQYNHNDRCLPSRRESDVAFSKVRVRDPPCGAPVASTKILRRRSSAWSVDLA